MPSARKARTIRAGSGPTSEHTTVYIKPSTVATSDSTAIRVEIFLSSIVRYAGDVGKKYASRRNLSERDGLDPQLAV